MSRIISSLRRKSENYHMVIHALLGVLSAYYTLDYFPQANRNQLLLYGVVGGILPDIDHFFYYFIYGKNQPYAQIAKYFIMKKQLKNWARFVKANHKSVTGIYSHNFLSLSLSLYFFYHFGLVARHPLLCVFFLAWSSHYVFDICEDLLFFHRLNPNWYLRFNRHRSGTTPPLHLS